MISPDSIPAWFAIPTAVVAFVTWLVIEVRHAAVDPDPEYSTLDKLDGLDSRTG